jgi:hypothetical protein
MNLAALAGHDAFLGHEIGAVLPAGQYEPAGHDLYELLPLGQ